MRFIICGAGGLGSVIGGMLARAGEDVTLVGRPRHMDAIKANGLHITGIYGDFVVREHLTCVTHPDQAQGEFDLMILLTKGKDTETALAEAASLKDRVRIVCSFQNGIGKEERLRDWAGRDKVIGASTIEGGVLLVPQFTLAADTDKGLRPGFSRAADPGPAERLFGHMAKRAEKRLPGVQTGRFGAHMRVSLVNDGPVTFWIRVPPHEAPE